MSQTEMICDKLRVSNETSTEITKKVDNPEIFLQTDKPTSPSKFESQIEVEESDERIIEEEITEKCEFTTNIQETESFPENIESEKRILEEEITEVSDETTPNTETETFAPDCIDFTKLYPTFRPNLFGKISFEVYTRGCKWSPDGLCILSLTDDNRLKIFDTPQQTSNQETSECDELRPAVTMKEAETVYDFQWFPLMDSSKPETCVLATTSQSQPIHLYDAFDGHIRATYRCFDHLDEMVAGRSLCFDPFGEKLYVGLKNEIRVFDVNIPGRDCEVRKTFQKKRKRNEVGLTGIISCISFNPAMPTVFALGTYSRNLGVYLDPLNLLCLHEAQQKGGITQVQFTPDGSKLLAGGRKDKEILVWDLRNPGTLYAILHREVNTNQRISFDISSCGQFVISGGSDGKIRTWDLKSDLSTKFEDPVIDPMWIGGDLHSDCINGVSLHPWKPILATSSGQRHFDQNYSDESENEKENNLKKVSQEFSMKFWNFDQLKF